MKLSEENIKRVGKCQDCFYSQILVMEETAFVRCGAFSNNVIAVKNVTECNLFVNPALGPHPGIPPFIIEMLKPPSPPELPEGSEGEEDVDKRFNL